MKIKQLLTQAGRTVTKHSPMILTGMGVVGLGATAYFSYKSRTRVEEIVSGIEEDRNNDVVVDRLEVAKELTGALALPVTLGVTSVACIVLSYKVQNNRIVTLAGALAASTAEQAFYREKYKRVHGEEAYKSFSAPTEQQSFDTVDEKGNAQSTIEEIRKDMPGVYGEWFDKSSEYTSDDHSYNMAYVDSVDEKLQLVLFQKGSLLLNEVREALGFERTRAGALMGWTTADTFELGRTVTHVYNPESGLKEPQIYIRWHEPKYIYDSVEFSPVVYGY